jgi:hypothetical protein
MSKNPVIEEDNDEDDRPTVVLDLNALKKQKLKHEEELANIAQELEFSVGDVQEAPKNEATITRSSPSTPAPVVEIQPEAFAVTIDPEDFASQFLEQRAKKEPTTTEATTVILFDFNSDFFQKNTDKFPKGFKYEIAKTLPELNKFLGKKVFQIVVFNYDVNPKAVNQLTTQIKKKFPFTKTMIMAKAISPDKAKIHAQTPSGAHGYCQFPIDAKKVHAEFEKIRSHSAVKKAA